MGNAASCTPSRVARGAAIRVIGVDGLLECCNVQLVRAAEIMAENPGHFVCDSHHLRVGCRIPGLLAQEELERRHLYFLLPMDMLYSVLTEEEMASLARRASDAMKRPAKRRSSTAGKRVLPVPSEFCMSPPEDPKEEAQEPARDGGRVGISCHRPWKPALDTIEEAPYLNNEKCVR